MINLILRRTSDGLRITEWPKERMARSVQELGGDSSLLEKDRMTYSLKMINNNLSKFEMIE